MVDPRGLSEPFSVAEKLATFAAGSVVTAGVGVGVDVGVGVGVGEPDAACKSKTQSGSPALLLPGVVKLCVPTFGNGEPATV